MRNGKYFTGVRDGWVLFWAALVCAICAGCVDASSVRGELRIDRSFHHPLEFKFHQENGEMVLQTVIYSGRGGYEKGTVVRNDSRRLTAEESALLSNAVRRVLADTIRDPNPPEGRDGSMWRLNVKAPQKKKAEVWSPGYNPQRNAQSLSDLGLLLWRLAKIDEPEKNFY